MLEHSTRRAPFLLALLLATSGCGWKLAARETPGAEPASATAAMLAPSFSLPADDGVFNPNPAASRRAHDVGDPSGRPDLDLRFISLDDLLADGRPAVLVFYRGHW